MEYLHIGGPRDLQYHHLDGKPASVTALTDCHVARHYGRVRIGNRTVYVSEGVDLTWAREEVAAQIQREAMEAAPR